MTPPAGGEHSFLQKIYKRESARKRALFFLALSVMSLRSMPPLPHAGEAKQREKQNGLNKHTKQLHKNPKYTLAPPARNGVRGLKIKKRKQKPKNSKSGLDTGGVCYNAFERKRTFLSACFGSLSFIHHKEEKFTMKLKKIASLMLAGVMAVSMLTACGDNTINDNEQNGKPEEPTVADVVSDVKAGIKSWNSDLEITVESSKNMDAAIKKGADLNTDYKKTEQSIVNTLNYVFAQKMTVKDSDFIDTANLVTWLNNASADGTKGYKNGDTAYAYAVVPVTNTAFDKNAGDMIGYALRDLKNIVPSKTDNSSNALDYKNLNVDYTMYVTAQDATMANNSVVTYVIAVLKADYSARV